MTINSTSAPWLRALRRYLLFIAPAHLGWEILQLPLYTIAWDGTIGEIAFAVIHCTGGDLLIALSALTIALVLFGQPNWPAVAYRPVLLTTLIIGVAYTIFSEWLNINIRQSWAYSAWMPIVPVFHVGLSPLSQWVVIPWLGLAWSRRAGHARELTNLEMTEDTSP